MSLVGKNGKVNISPKNNLTQYKKITPKEEFDFLLKQAKLFSNSKTKMAFISATPQGGGVAIMRHSMLALYRSLGLDIDWYVLKDDENAFHITKRKFHNVLQGVSDKSVKLTKTDKEYYGSWIKLNAHLFNGIFKKYDVIVIDDPQPSGLIKHIKEINKNLKIIYRSHIEILADKANQKGTPQNISWQFIWNNIKTSDLFIWHPVRSFVPKTVPKQKLVYAPPSTDPLDDLNIQLSKTQIEKSLTWFNSYLKVSGQQPLDLNRPYIAQIARFDPSKGIPDLLQAYKKLRNKIRSSPQLVIVGNGSIDDPDGIPILNLVNQMLEAEEYRQIRQDIKVARLPHNDLVLNAILSKAHVVTQLSYREGFEFKITEALLKGKPVIIYNSGGMPIQVIHKKSGFIAKRGDAGKVAEYLHKLLTDKVLYKKMSKQASKVPPDALLISHSASWLWLANALHKDGEIKAEGKYIKNLTGQSKFTLPRLKIIN